MACFTVFISHTNPFPKYILDDGDMKIDEKEVPFLALRLQIQLEQYGIKLDTSKFDAMVKEDNGEENALYLRSGVKPRMPLLIIVDIVVYQTSVNTRKRHLQCDEVLR